MPFLSPFQRRWTRQVHEPQNTEDRSVFPERNMKYAAETTQTHTFRELWRSREDLDRTPVGLHTRTYTQRV